MNISLLLSVVCGWIGGAVLAAEVEAGASLAPQFVQLPGKPFGLAVSGDGNTVFVSLTIGQSRIAVVKRSEKQYKLDRVAPLPAGPTGLALTHDGQILVVTMGESVALLDTTRLTSGSGDPLVAKFSDGNNAGSVYTNVTEDDKTLFVSDEGAEAISVIDLEKLRQDGNVDHAKIGKIPVGEAPIALTFSKDGRHLFTTSEIAADSWGWPDAVKPEGGGAGNRQIPEGAVVVVDVARAKTDPAQSVVARVPAGGSPVRMTISPDGERLYVTARGSNAALAFDAAKLVNDPEHARLSATTVGSAPVPVAVIQGGKTLVVGNSNRFGADSGAAQFLTVLDTSKLGNSAAVIGTIKAGSFPREMRVSTDGSTLFVTNFNSSSLEIIDAQNPPLERKD